jgi:predicted MFS family arabinose efflux permease
LKTTTREGTIIATLASVQFINILDFMIVMPMGPDFAAALGIPLSRLGIIAGSYTAAAAVAGLAGAFFLDRFDRRPALLIALGGLCLGTAACAAATGLGTLSAARILAGAFGGPATSLTIAIVADVIPEERRGRSMGILMSAFSVASVLGVPAGLELARMGGWRLPFVAVAGVGAVIWIVAWFALPSLKGHLAGARHDASARRIAGLVSKPIVISSLAMTTCVMMGAFIIIPNLATYLMGNLGFPRERLGLLFLIGGALSFVLMHLTGRVVDRVGAFRVGTAASMLLLFVLYAGFYSYWPVMPVTVIFVLFMLAGSARNVAYNTLTSRVPLAAERARFMSIRSAVQHLSASAGAFLSTRMLTEGSAGALIGMPSITVISMGLAMAIPFLFWHVETGLIRRNHCPVTTEPADVACEPGP